MTLTDYQRFYIDLVVTVLGPAVKREAHIDVKLGKDPARQAELENQKNGLVVLALVALIEESFLTKGQMRALRTFSACPPSLPAGINPDHLSGFIYIRDCVGHNALPRLLPAGTNTAAFQNAVASGNFPWATLIGDDIVIADLEELHKIVLRLFGQTV